MARPAILLSGLASPRMRSTRGSMIAAPVMEATARFGVSSTATAWRLSSQPAAWRPGTRSRRERLVRSQCRAGCAVLAVTVATDSGELLQHAGAVFRTWRGQLTELFEQGGLSAREAAQFATTLVAASEGAVVLSRAEQSLEPFDLVAAQLLEQARKLSMG
jgi:hypothetical protein